MDTRVLPGNPRGYLRSVDDRVMSVMQALDMGDVLNSEFTNDVREIIKELTRLRTLERRREKGG